MQINLVSICHLTTFSWRFLQELDKDRILRHLDKILIEQVDKAIIMKNCVSMRFYASCASQSL